MKVFRQWLVFPALMLALIAAAAAQDKTSPNQPANQSANQNPNQNTDEPDEPDQPVVSQSQKLKANPAEALSTTWQILQSASKASKPQAHVSLLVALGTLGGYKQAEQMLTAAMKDPDVDIRLAAVAAAGSTADRALIPPLRIAMEDQAPEVVVTAAASLWKMGDRTGMDVLQGVLTGQMKAKSGLLKSSMHVMNRDLHDPGALATMGAEEGAGMLFGPFGIAITAAKFVHPGPTPNSTRVIAAGLLAADPTEANRKALLLTLHDKDPYVRQASAKALARFHGKEVTDALLDGLDDPKPSVRFMAAASYIRVASPIQPERPHRTARASASTKAAATKTD